MGAVLFGLCLAIAPVLVVFYHKPHLFWVTATLASGFVFGAGAAQRFFSVKCAFFAQAVVHILSLSASVGTAIIMGMKGYGYWALVGYECCSSGGLCNLGVGHF